MLFVMLPCVEMRLGSDNLSEVSWLPGRLFLEGKSKCKVSLPVCRPGLARTGTSGRCDMLGFATNDKGKHAGHGEEKERHRPFFLYRHQPYQQVAKNVKGLLLSRSRVLAFSENLSRPRLPANQRRPNSHNRNSDVRELPQPRPRTSRV